VKTQKNIETAEKKLDSERIEKPAFFAYVAF